MASFKVYYSGKDITADISASIEYIKYHDKAIGEADELELKIDNEDLRYMNSWNPKKGDVVRCTIIDADGKTLDTGLFEVDELVFAGSASEGDVVAIKALAAGVKSQIRTKTSFAHQGKTLKQIIDSYAYKYHYRVSGLIKDFKIATVTQYHESDLSFIARLAQKYGYLFSIKGDVLVFSYTPEMANNKAVVTIDKSMIIEQYRLQDKVAGIYVKGRNRFFNPIKKKIAEIEVDADDVEAYDDYRCNDIVDSDDEGMHLTTGRMYKKNMEQVEVNVNVSGNVYLLSGSNVMLSGFGVYDTKYIISEAVHTISRDNEYITSITGKKILPVNKDAGIGVASENVYTTPTLVPGAEYMQNIVNLLNAMLQEANNNNLTYEIVKKYYTPILNANMSVRTAGNGETASYIEQSVKKIQEDSKVLPLTAAVEATTLRDQVIGFINGKAVGDE